ncbi:arsenical pump-driving ATPase [Timonella senegalensis]|uniref:arsenical pump-driving ATPase n=1 Tax=Timonella senegalensis TaxID=1465825 RepID=UPI002FDD4544
MKFLENPPRHLFFTGKGGVGKTSVACAVAVTLADQGRQVLLVSTDPASNVGQVFGQSIGNTVTAIDSVPRLSALEIDPEQEAADYRERTLAPVKGLLSEVDFASVTEQLSGSCTTEIASFNKFTELLTAGDTSELAQFDHIVFDTAPTGHTVRLLQLPGEWSRFIDDGKGDTSCLGPMSGLEKTRSTYASALEELSRPESTRLVLVARPQTGAIAEAEDTQLELLDAGMSATHLVMNGVLPTEAQADPFADALRAREAELLGQLPQGLSGLDLDIISLRPNNVMGVAALRDLFVQDASEGAHVHVSSTPFTAVGDGDTAGIDALVETLALQDSGLVMFMGKGGVGKTTIASAVAVALADRGKEVHLTTTDPAAHIAQAVRGDLPTLTVSAIDPEQATADYRERVMRTKGKSLDAEGRANLAEDLRSPCTQEVAVFQAFSRVVGEAKDRIVIMDTAPTGHTLLLMDAAGAYHREIVRSMGEDSSFTTPHMKLQDPHYTKIVIVSLPETTPVLEAIELKRDLERANIAPWAWVMNQVLAGVETSSPILQERATAQAEPIRLARTESAQIFEVPMQREVPAGITQLRHLVEDSVGAH